jgi:hypothetical protein
MGLIDPQLPLVNVRSPASHFGDGPSMRLLRQVHLAQECFESGIAANRIERRI